MIGHWYCKLKEITTCKTSQPTAFQINNNKQYSKQTSFLYLQDSHVPVVVKPIRERTPDTVHAIHLPWACEADCPSGSIGCRIQQTATTVILHRHHHQTTQTAAKMKPIYRDSLETWPLLAFGNPSQEFLKSYSLIKPVDQVTLQCRCM